MIHLFVIAVATILAHAVSTTSDSASCVFASRPKAPSVPKNMTSWKKKYPEYSPVEWTADCEYAECDIQTPELLTFNKVTNGIDRTRARSCYRKPPYKVDASGHPLNPAGRTGFYGRGRLPRWGPNHLVKLLLQRQDDGEYSSFMRMGENGAQLPGFYVDSPSGKWITGKLEEQLKAHIQRLSGNSDEAEKAIRKVEKDSKSLLKGSIPSLKNTDNAWVEIHLRAVKCSEHEAFCTAMVNIFEKKDFQWTPADSTRDEKSYLNSVDQKFDIETLDYYSAFCKAIVIKKIKKHPTASFAIGTLMAMTLPLLVASIVASIIAVSIWSPAIVLAPIIAFLLIASVPPGLGYVIIPRNCR